jgi:hypothetical protein
MTPALEHFLNLVESGQYPGASGGEKRARRLAKILAQEVPGLDSSAIQGLGEFAELCAAYPQTAADLVRPRRRAVAQ